MCKRCVYCVQLYQEAYWARLMTELFREVKRQAALTAEMPLQLRSLRAALQKLAALSPLIRLNRRPTYIESFAAAFAKFLPPSLLFASLTSPFCFTYISLLLHLHPPFSFISPVISLRTSYSQPWDAFLRNFHIHIENSQHSNLAFHPFFIFP